MTSSPGYVNRSEVGSRRQNHQSLGVMGYDKKTSRIDWITGDKEDFVCTRSPEPRAIPAGT